MISLYVLAAGCWFYAGSAASADNRNGGHIDRWRTFAWLASWLAVSVDAAKLML